MSQDSQMKANVQMNAGLDLPENGKFEDYLNVLEEHRRTSEQEGNFVEADMAKNRIEELKVQEAQRQIEQLMLKHQQDRLQIEESHAQEYQAFQQEWDQRLQSKEQEFQQQIQQLDERHQQELEKNRIDLQQRIPTNFKPSSELLNLKKIQDQLARQKEYAEAHKVQAKIIDLEKEEQLKYEQVREKKIVAAETLLIQKQQQQMHALRKKCENSLNEDRNLRDDQHMKMLQRYQNVKREQENQQNLERIRTEKQFGKQILASQTSLSYGMKKNDISAAYQTKTGFNSNQSPQKRTTWGSTNGRESNNPASKPSYN
eukprot:403353664